jgi:hypothetical protein
MASNISQLSANGQVAWQIDDAGLLAKTSNNGNLNTQGVSFSQGNATPALVADRMYAKELTINPSSTLDIDLTGVLLDFFGGANNFARVKLISIEHKFNSLAVAGIEIGKSDLGANWVVAWTMPPIMPGGFFQLALPDTTGIAVTGGTGDLFRIKNLDGTNIATVRFVFGGKST